MYETSIKTWALAIAIAVAAGAGLMAAAGTTLHQTRIVAGLDGNSVVALEAVTVGGQASSRTAKLAHACRVDPAASL